MNLIRDAFALLATCATIAATPASAQQPTPSAPPKVLKIERDWLKPGKYGTHENVEAEFPRAAAGAKGNWHWLALGSETGPRQLWAVIGFDSFAEWQKSEAAMENMPAFDEGLQRLHERDGSILWRDDVLAAVYDESLSYRPIAGWQRMRFYLVTTFQIRAGHDYDFLEIDRLTRAAHEEAKIDEHWVVYRVISGAPTGTYLVFAPMKSLKELDESDARHAPYLQALGDLGQKKLHELEAMAYERESEDVFAVNPKLSYVSKEWAESDPEFWTPKPAGAKSSTPSRKEAAKP